MGRHPSRDEIASADYWGASVWVAEMCAPGGVRAALD